MSTDPRPHLRPTRPLDLALGVLAGALVAGVVRAARHGGSIVPLPPSAVITVGLAAVAVFATAGSVRARLAGRPRTKPIMPLTVARMAALARATSLTGAGVAGAWLVLLVDRLRRVADDVTAARGDAIVAGLGVVSAALLVAAALRLESACRLPPSDDPPDPDR
jgi:hypothetical protein